MRVARMRVRFAGHFKAGPWLSFSLALMGLCSTAALATIQPCTEEALQRGLNYLMVYPQNYGHIGFGCGFADLDNDGHQDVIILGRADKRAGIFRNDGAGDFTDHTLSCGIPLLPQAVGFAAADYDGDGLVDIYFTQFNIANVLMRNLGNFQFQDVTAAAGVGDNGSSNGAHWGDFDGDGWLDLYVCNYSNTGVAGYMPNKNVLYRNKGDGTFENVSAQQGVDDPYLGFQAVWFDMDRDGDLDLYLSNDRGHYAQYGPNRLWRNDNGQMVDISAQSGAGLGLFSMGLACGDFDGNGYPDLYATNIPSGPINYNPLFLNQGNGTFIEAALAAGVSNPISSWGCIFFDFTNNGHLDLYVNNQFFPNRLYINSGTFPALNMAAEANVQGTFGPSATGFQSFSSAVADVDGNGTLDLLLNNSNGNVKLFMNHEGAERRWIRYRVVGSHPNRHAIGANIDTRAGDMWQFREIYGAGNGYLGQNETIIHVGVDQAFLVDEAVVKWPGGTVTRTLTSLPTNRLWTIYPPERLGDYNNDGVIDHTDFLAFAACFNFALQPGDEMMDFDGDSIVDMADFAMFLESYHGTLLDCDQDDQPDLLQILLSPHLDSNQNGLLDSCEGAACSADLAPPGGNGMVNTDDLLVLLSAWGPCQKCTADIAPAPLGNGVVNTDDLLVLLSLWGSCK